MHPDQLVRPNAMTYEGDLVNHQTCHSLLLSKEFLNAYRGWLKAAPKEKVNVVAVNVADGICAIDQGTLSRYNTANVSVGMSLIGTLFKAGVLKDHNVKIVIQYTYQRQDWICELVQFSLGENVPGMIYQRTTDRWAFGHRTIFVSL